MELYKGNEFFPRVGATVLQVMPQKGPHILMICNFEVALFLTSTRARRVSL